MFSAQTLNQIVSVERILDYSEIEPEEKQPSRTFTYKLTVVYH